MGQFFSLDNFLTRFTTLNIIAELTKIRQRSEKGANSDFADVYCCDKRLGAEMSAVILMLVIMIQIVIAVPVSAYQPGEFPGQGLRQNWLSAGRVNSAACDLSEKKQFDQAIAKFQSAISIYPYDSRFYFNLASTYDLRGKPGDLVYAESAMHKGLKLYSSNWQNWAYLSELIYAIDPKRAKECIAANQRAYSLSPPTDAMPQLKKNMLKFEKALHSNAIGHR